MAPEEWRTIPTFPNYEASTLGRIRNIRRGNIIKTRRNPSGYTVLNLRKAGKSYSLYAHRLVCLAFHGPSPSDKRLVGHGDGSKSNNRPENLRWVSASENMADAYGHGKHQRGLLHPNARLSDADIQEIIALRKQGHRIIDIAKWYRCSNGYVSGLARRKVRRSPALEPKP